MILLGVEMYLNDAHVHWWCIWGSSRKIKEKSLYLLRTSFKICAANRKVSAWRFDIHNLWKAFIINVTRLRILFDFLEREIVLIKPQADESCLNFLQLHSCRLEGYETAHFFDWIHSAVWSHRNNCMHFTFKPSTVLTRTALWNFFSKRPIYVKIERIFWIQKEHI